MTQEQTGFAFQQPTETHYKTEPQLPSSEFQAATFSPTPADSYRSDQYSGYYDSSYQSQLDSSLRHSPGFSASLTEQSGLPDEAYMYGPNDFYQSVVESREIRLASVPELTVESPSPTSPNSDAILTPKRQVKGRRIKDVPKVSEDSDDSEPDEPDSDEDYPDEIIEVPSLPPGSFTDDFSSAKEELSTAKGDDIIHEITKAFATGLDYNDAQFDQFVSATRAARRTDKTDAVETDIFTDIQSLCSSDSQTAVGSTSKSPSKTATPTPPPIPARSVTPPGTVGSITLPPPIPRATSKTADKTSAVETYDNQPATSEFLHFDSSSYTPVTLASSDGYLGTISTDNTSRSGTAVTYASVVEPHMTDSTSSATSASGYASDKEFLSYEESEEDESSSSYRDESTTDKRHTQQQQQDDDIDVQQVYQLNWTLCKF